MKRKIIALLSSLILCIPFITPVYADGGHTSGQITYWDGSIMGFDVSYNALLQYDESLAGFRCRSNYKPNATTIFYRYANNYIGYGMCWYVGEYPTISAGNVDANYFRSQLFVYYDVVDKNSNTYSTSLATNDLGGFQTVSVQVGTMYRIFVLYANSRKSATNASTMIGNSVFYSSDVSTSSQNDRTLAWNILKQELGYDTIGSNNVLKWGKAKNEIYLNNSLDPGHIRQGVLDAFGDANVIEPAPGTGSGSVGNNSGGYGNGIPDGSGNYGGSSIQFDGSNNQVQSQSQYMTQNQSIESNAVNVTVNNEITGGGGSSGSTESDVDRINALDNLLSNQNVGTSFSSAIQNINNFRQLGVAFADTTNVFLGWLPSWVTALLGLMFTLLFFFIILRLLKVFHG